MPPLRPGVDVDGAHAVHAARADREGAAVAGDFDRGAVLGSGAGGDRGVGVAELAQRRDDPLDQLDVDRGLGPVDLVDVEAADVGDALDVVVGGGDEEPGGFFGFLPGDGAAAGGDHVEARIRVGPAEGERIDAGQVGRADHRDLAAGEGVVEVGLAEVGGGDQGARVQPGGDDPAGVADRCAVGAGGGDDLERDASLNVGSPGAAGIVVGRDGGSGARGIEVDGQPAAGRFVPVERAGESQRAVGELVDLVGAELAAEAEGSADRDFAAGRDDVVGVVEQFEDQLVVVGVGARGRECKQRGGGERNQRGKRSERPNRRETTRFTPPKKACSRTLFVFRATLPLPRLCRRLVVVRYVG